jgi:hypothetical protein
MYGITAKGRKTRRIDSSSLREVVKYATKAAKFSDQPARVLEFYRAFKNVRRAQAFGSFLGSLGEDKEEKAEKSNEFIGCACGKCRWKDAVPCGLYHVSQTELRADGERQLKLFAFDSSPPESPPEPEELKQDSRQSDLFFHQAEIGWSFA